MKTPLILFTCLVCFVTGFSQPNARLMEKHNFKVPLIQPKRFQPTIGSRINYPVGSLMDALSDPTIGTTRYDLQTRGSAMNRIHLYPDEAIGTVWTMAMQNDFQDIGTGYNYSSDGTSWEPSPTSRIEPVKTGCPSYAPCGPNGEIIVAHRLEGTKTLFISIREIKNFNNWTFSEVQPPPGATGIMFPRMVSGGTDHNNIHILCITEPVDSGGTLYQGLDGALIYARSTDGGSTWSDWQVIPGLTSADYLGFYPDTYAWAEPREEILAFTVGSSWYDQVLMKSTDNGETWIKTTIWQCPFNQWTGGDSTGVFYCPDGACDAALDAYGDAHIVFGLLRASGDATGEKFWYPWTDGIIYWNEQMPQLPHSLNPDSLQVDFNYVGWCQDTTVWNAPDSALAWYYLSMSSFPDITIDQNNTLFFAWSSVIISQDPDGWLLRQPYLRLACVGPLQWCPYIVHVTDDFLYSWSECISPLLFSTSDRQEVSMVFQEDTLSGEYGLFTPGIQGQSSVSLNKMRYVDDLVESSMLFWCPPCTVGLKQNEAIPDFKVNQNFPNPFTDHSILSVLVRRKGTLNIIITNPAGQTVDLLFQGFVDAGKHSFTLKANALKPGLYFYTVTFNNQSITKRMIVL